MRKEVPLSFILKLFTGNDLLKSYGGTSVTVWKWPRMSRVMRDAGWYDDLTPKASDPCLSCCAYPSVAFSYIRSDHVRSDSAARPVRQPGGPGAVWRHVQRWRGGEGVQLGLLWALLSPDCTRRQVWPVNKQNGLLPRCLPNTCWNCCRQTWLRGRCSLTWSPKWSSTAWAGPPSPAGGAMEKLHTSVRSKAPETTGPTGGSAETHRLILLYYCQIFESWPQNGSPGSFFFSIWIDLLNFLHQKLLHLS